MPLSPNESLFLQLPAETRLNIYSHLVDIKGVLVVYSRYDLSREVNTDVVKVMHVNRLIRGEVQEFFDKNQAFEFRSTPAIDNFIDRIGRHHASLVTDIRFSEWMCKRIKTEHIINLLGWFTGLESLQLNGIESYATRRPDGSWTHVANENTMAILDASPSLARGHIWYYFCRYPAPLALRAPNLGILFVPREIDTKLLKLEYEGIVERYGSPHWRSDGCSFHKIVLPEGRIPKAGNANNGKVEDNSSTDGSKSNPSGSDSAGRKRRKLH